MKVVLQRVSSASVVSEGKLLGEIGQGFLILVGYTHSDEPSLNKAMASKIANLRIFSDEKGKFNHSLLDVKGAVLVVSQFTLYANANGGRRPDFLAAAKPEKAIPLYEDFLESFKALGISVQKGEFGADMKVELVNDGPVTIELEM